MKQMTLEIYMSKYKLLLTMVLMPFSSNLTKINGDTSKHFVIQ